MLQLFKATVLKDFTVSNSVGFIKGYVDSKNKEDNRRREGIWVGNWMVESRGKNDRSRTGKRKRVLSIGSAHTGYTQGLKKVDAQIVAHQPRSMLDQEGIQQCQELHNNMEVAERKNMTLILGQHDFKGQKEKEANEEAEASQEETMNKTLGTCYLKQEVPNLA
ncbi:hypothetical protein Tco_0278616 [Tanacetum coccineum]